MRGSSLNFFKRLDAQMLINVFKFVFKLFVSGVISEGVEICLVRKNLVETVVYISVPRKYMRKKRKISATLLELIL